MPDSSWVRPFPPGKHLHFSPLRRVQQATDSDGNSYDILVQTEEMSCGVAASAILIDLYNKTCSAGPDAEARLKNIAARFPGSLVESDKLWAKGKDYGSTADNIENLLDSQGVPVTLKDARWLKKTGSPVIIEVSRLRSPAAILWGWYSNGKRHGGHFTVGARMSSGGNVVILDPWDGSLSELPPPHPYNGNGYADCVLYTN